MTDIYQCGDIVFPGLFILGTSLPEISLGDTSFQDVPSPYRYVPRGGLLGKTDILSVCDHSVLLCGVTPCGV